MAQDDDNPSISPGVTKRQAWLQQAEDMRLPASTRIEAIENLAREYQAARHAAWLQGEPAPTRSVEQQIQQGVKRHTSSKKEYETIQRLSLLLHTDDDRNVRRAIVRLLPNWGEEALGTLIPALKIPDIRSEAVKALDSMALVTGQREIRLLDELARLRTGESPPAFRRFRSFFDDVLGMPYKFGRDPRFLDFLKERMRTGDQWQRALATSVLCGLGETEAAFGAVSDLKARVRKSLAVAIGHFNEQTGAEVLHRLLKDKDVAVSKAARISMERLENPEVKVPRSGAPHGNSEWAALLKELSDFRLTDPELRVRLAGDGKIWLGETGATETQITALEQRIGQPLPPSYRSFLMVSNGFQSPENSIPELYGTEAVDWFRVRHAEWAKAHRVDSCLQVSEAGCSVGRERPGYFAVILLNPQVKSPKGEWLTYFFADWNPGIGSPYRSFGEFMSNELEPYCEWRP